MSQNGPEDFCALCDTHKNNVRLIQGGTGAVCVNCLKLCIEILDEDQASPPYVGGEHPPRLPAALVTELHYHATDVMLHTLALSGEPQPYSAVAPIAGYHHRDRNFYAMLGRSLHEDHAAGKPLRASLVINKGRGVPGQTYFDVCRQLGYTIPQGGEQAFWHGQLSRF